MAIINLSSLASIRRKVITFPLADGNEVHLLAMSAADAIAAEQLQKTGNVFAFAKTLLAKSMIDEHGNTYATEEQLDQLPVDLLLEMFKHLTEQSVMLKKT